MGNMSVKGWARWARLDLGLSVPGLLATAFAVVMTAQAVMIPWMEWSGYLGYDNYSPGDPTPRRVEWLHTFTSTLSVPDATMDQSATSVRTSASMGDHLLSHTIAAGGWLLVAVSTVFISAAVVSAFRLYPEWQAVPARVQVSRRLAGAGVALLGILAVLLAGLVVTVQQEDVVATYVGPNPDARLNQLLPQGPALLIGAVLLQVAARTPLLAGKRPIGESSPHAAEVDRQLAAEDPEG